MYTCSQINMLEHLESSSPVHLSAAAASTLAQSTDAVSVALALRLSPALPPLLPVLQGYDTTIIPLVVLIILMSVAALASLLGLLVFHARAALYARPLSYHADVLHQQ